MEVLWWSGLILRVRNGGVYFSGRSSDRRGDGKWHCAASMGATELFSVFKDFLKSIGAC